VAAVLASGLAAYLTKESQRSETQTRLDVTTQALHAGQAKIASLTTQVADLTTKSNQLDARITAQNTQISALRDQIGSLKSANKGLKSTLAVCRKAVGEGADLQSLSARAYNDLVAAINAFNLGDYITSDFYASEADSLTGQMNSLLASANADFNSCQSGFGF
jgi:chromosome segregation ATPase